MKTPIVQETRRAGHSSKPDAHRRQVGLVTRSLIAVREPRYAWDERTRTERRAA
jgi:hypothetical protein